LHIIGVIRGIARFGCTGGRWVARETTFALITISKIAILNNPKSHSSPAAALSASLCKRNDGFRVISSWLPWLAQGQLLADCCPSRYGKERSQLAIANARKPPFNVVATGAKGREAH
jgi:hypothetical protein